MKYILSLILAFIFLSNVNAQDSSVSSERPKLVVGIVVDQMRYDYLTRFKSKYGDGGFKRMMKEGFSCRNHHFNYIPTYTAPGHASIFTGTTPKYHGIIGNNWYDKIEKLEVYCASDYSVDPVGTDSNAGRMSPHRMLTSTFCDENRLFTQLRGKTIGVAIKDRGAILPAGHTANAAYWFHGKDEGKFITSSFYMDQLPEWVNRFNNSDTADSYFKVWDTYYDISTYTESGIDNYELEGGFKGKETPTFPYDLNALKDQNGGYELLKGTPYGNSLTTDFAIAAIEGEHLGSDDYTDVLTVSYSSTDYVGHNFGVSAKETEDTYIRLDKDLERLLNYLDTKVGKGDYTVFLTSDHGAVEIPAYLKANNIPSGYVYNQDRKQEFQKFLMDTFGAVDIIEDVSNDQIFFNHAKIKELGLNHLDVQQLVADEQLTYENVSKVYTAHTMNTTHYSEGVEHLLQNGYNQKRSGDVIVVNDVSYINFRKTGTTHGSGSNYDTHVPLLFFGKGIKQGYTNEKTVIPDIAPTISALLGISFPNASTGRPLDFVID
ncbi:MAG: alkaline phosphatase family protein [Psychroserpens sp.]|nr:alkaline phosphatase family protein [Psychroserpens sp.]